ncbi:MAG: hypothetical protein RLZZ382_898 [Bacteroidota bacterium]
MNRRAFVGLAGLTSLGALTSSFELRSSAQRKGKKLTILHTNDTHSNIDSFPLNHAKYPGMGGVAKRAALIEQIRREDRREEEHVILVDSGDIFQGTPYFNRYHGELEMKLMSAMQYDVATMGNHDFDIGMEGFKNAQRFANFPFVCSGVKIGFFGIGVNLDGLSPASCFAGMNYIDPIEQANNMAQLLSDLGCDLVVCLSHLGFEYSSSQVSDKVLAAETANIHLILGGHTHTFMEKPLIMENANKKPVLINQTGWAGLFLGRIDIDFQRGIFKHQALLVQ